MAVGQRPQGTAVGIPAAPRLAAIGGERIPQPAPPPLYVEVDHQAYPLTAQEDGGVIQAELAALPVGYAYLVERVVVRTDSGAATNCALYVGGVGDAELRDYTSAGNQNTADYGPPLLVPGGKSLIVRWEGADAGSHGTATVQARIVYRPDSGIMR